MQYETDFAVEKETPMAILKIILAILIPPVTAYLQVGVCTRFRINIILTLCCGLPEIIHALWLVLTVKTA